VFHAATKDAQSPNLVLVRSMVAALAVDNHSRLLLGSAVANRTKSLRYDGLRW